jgi:glycerophosphoryl diester phosphodiesterase
MRSSRSRRSELERLGAVPFAHRGLHGGALIENSGGAVAAAVAHGFGGEAMPRLAEALEIVGGRTPLLIEVKSPDRQVARLCAAVARALGSYDGPVAVMSFNPEVGGWFSRRAANVLGGLVVTENGRRGLRGRVERHWSLWRARADFLAYDVRDLPSSFAERARNRGLPVYTWTVRSEADRARAAAHADQIIFEAPAP